MRVWRLADGEVGKPLRGRRQRVSVAVGNAGWHPVIVSGGGDQARARRWPTAPGGEPLTATAGVTAVAVGALPDGTPVIVSGSFDAPGG